MLEELLGRPVRGFAYPYGKAGDHSYGTVALVEASGFDHVCSVGHRVSAFPGSRSGARTSPLARRRVRAPPHRLACRLADFVDILAGAGSKQPVVAELHDSDGRRLVRAYSRLDHPAIRAIVVHSELNTQLVATLATDRKEIAAPLRQAGALTQSRLEARRAVRPRRRSPAGEPRARRADLRVEGAG